MTKHRFAVIMLVILGCLVGLLGWNCFAPVSVPAQAVNWQSTTRWVMPTTPRHRFYLRRTVNVADQPQAGWLRLSADNDFVLYVNGRAIAEEYSYFGRIPRNSLGLAKYASYATQALNDVNPYDLRTGDVIQTSYTKDWKLTGYFDLTQYLKVGENVIAVEVQASHPHPRLVAEGEIYPTSDATSAISLNTGSTDWVFSELPLNRQKLKWFNTEFPDHDWQTPQQQPIQEKTYSRLSSQLFSRRLQGKWITGPEDTHGSINLQKQWITSSGAARAFVRFAGEGHYSLLINNQLVHQTQLAAPNQLNLYEVTALLHPGTNTITARLLQPLATESKAENSVPLSLFLDGWSENSQGQVIDELVTDTSWHSFVPSTSSDISFNHLITQTTSQEVSIWDAPLAYQFNRVYQGDASQNYIGRYLVQQACWMGGGLLFIFLSTWVIGYSLQHIWKPSLSYGATALMPDAVSSPLLMGTAALTPSLFFLSIVGLLKHRYGEAERGIFFAQANTDGLILWVAIGLLGITMLWMCRPPTLSRWHKGRFLFLLAWLGAIGLSIVLTSQWLLLLGIVGYLFYCLSREWEPELSPVVYKLIYALRTCRPNWLNFQWHYYHWILSGILLLGFCLRAYDIGFNDLEPDENVSYDAVRGILRTGAPIATSGIWYTRGPLFHYPLALWLKIVGASPEHARMWSVLWAIGTLIMVFIFTRLISGKVWIALIATLVIALDPWELWYSRNVRFYQQTQFLFMLSYWAFYRGFIDISVQTQAPKRWYQYTCCIALACILLTQEVTMTLLPVFTLGALYFYRPYHWRSDWRVLISGFMTSSLFVFNAVVFSIKCLTPLVGLSSMTTGHLKFQVGNVTFFGTDFFVAFNRMHVIYSFLFFAGWLYFCWKADGRKLFLFNSVLINVIFVTVLVSLKASRYSYPYYPLFSLLAIYSAFILATELGKYLQTWVGSKLPMQKIAVTAMCLLLLGNIEPDRIIASYSESLTPRHIEISQYIVDHKQPGDIVISNTPSVHANVLEGADYYVPHRMSFFDAVYLRDGRLIDRWEGRRVLTSSDQLDHVLTEANRVWIHVFHQPHLPRDAELAKFYDTLQTMSQPVLDSYGASLRLWQRDDGVLRPTPNRGRDLGAY